MSIYPEAGSSVVSVSCSSIRSAQPVEGSGDVVTYNGTSWSSPSHDHLWPCIRVLQGFDVLCRGIGKRRLHLRRHLEVHTRRGGHDRQPLHCVVSDHDALRGTGLHRVCAHLQRHDVVLARCSGRNQRHDLRVASTSGFRGGGLAATLSPITARRGPHRLDRLRSQDREDRLPPRRVRARALRGGGLCRQRPHLQRHVVVIARLGRPLGGSLSSVSCPSSGFCAAVDADGNALT